MTIDAANARCPHCEGTTWVETADGRGTVPCRCRERRQAAARTLGVRQNLEALVRAHPADLDRRPVTDLPAPIRRTILFYTSRLEEHLRDGKGLWFYGGPGSGKSAAAVAIAKEAERQRFTTSYRSVPEHLDKLRAAYNEYTPRTREELIEKLVAVDLLVLDDFGAERTNDWVLEQIYLIVNGRSERRRATIVTSNHSPDSLEAALGSAAGPRIVSRLHGMCGKPILFPSLDHRREDAWDWEEAAAATPG
jgi:DNA replication protein DnaC